MGRLRIKCATVRSASSRLVPLPSFPASQAKMVASVGIADEGRGRARIQGSPAHYPKASLMPMAETFWGGVP